MVQQLAPRRMTLFYIFTCLFFLFLNNINGGQASFIPKPDKIFLKNGKVLEGNIIVSGPKGVVVVVENSEKLENFVPAGEIEKVERFKNKAELSTDDILRTYGVKAEDGRLVLTTEKVEQKKRSPKREVSKDSDKDDDKEKRKKKRSPLPSILNPRRSLLDPDKKIDKKPENNTGIFESDTGEENKETSSEDGHEDFDKLID